MRSEQRTFRVALVAAATTLVAAVGAGSASAAGSGADSGASPRVTSSADFPRPLDTDSRYFALTPGTQYTYEGTITEGQKTLQHEVVFTVTDLVKGVGGINARVILDEDRTEGILTEIELAFFAKDAHDNVWTRGEYPEEYEDGVFQGAPSTWITGERRAQAGILVPGHPRTGTPSFVQGFAPAVEFFDVGRVIATGLHVCVPLGCFDDVVEIKEKDPNAPEDGAQLKYYAPRVGLVKVAAQGGGAQEVLRLTSMTPLKDGALRSLRDTALLLDARAFKTVKDYRATSPAHVQR